VAGAGEAEPAGEGPPGFATLRPIAAKRSEELVFQKVAFVILNRAAKERKFPSFIL
jgi:hypothetical protein